MMIMRIMMILITIPMMMMMKGRQVIAKPWILVKEFVDSEMLVQYRVLWFDVILANLQCNLIFIHTCSSSQYLSMLIIRSLNHKIIWLSETDLWTSPLGSSARVSLSLAHWNQKIRTMMTMMTMIMMTLAMAFYHWSLSMPGHIGDDHHVARADPELRQQLLHLLRLHPRLIIMIL